MKTLEMIFFFILLISALWILATWIILAIRNSIDEREGKL